MKGAYDETPFRVSEKWGSYRHLLGGNVLPVALKGEALGASIAIDGAVSRPREVDGIDLVLMVEEDELSQILNALSALAPLPADPSPIGHYRLPACLKVSPERLSVGASAHSLGGPELMLMTVGGSIEDAAKAKGLALGLVVEGRDLAPLAKAAGVELCAFPAFRIAGNYGSVG